MDNSCTPTHTNCVDDLTHPVPQFRCQGDSGEDREEKIGARIEYFEQLGLIGKLQQQLVVQEALKGGQALQAVDRFRSSLSSAQIKSRWKSGDMTKDPCSIHRKTSWTVRFSFRISKVSIG